MIKISILLAVYNGESFLEEAIRSVICQEYLNWELIIVDNGSTDSTFTIINKFVSIDSRIKIFKIPQKGKIQAYNLAFEKSTGEYICFFACDDLLTFDSLEKRLKKISKVPFSYTTCLLETFSSNRKYNGIVFPKNRINPNYSGGSIFFSRDLALSSFPIPEILPNEDTWISLHLKVFGKNAHIPEVLYKYRIHENNSYGYGLSFKEKKSKFLHRMSAYTLFYEKYNNSLQGISKDKIKYFIKGLKLVEKNRILSIIFLLKLPVKERIIFIFYCSPFLFKIRYKYFKFFSGNFFK